MKKRSNSEHDRTSSTEPAGIPAGKQARTGSLVQLRKSSPSREPPVLQTSSTTGDDVAPRADESFVDSLLRPVQRKERAGSHQDHDVQEAAAAGTSGTAHELPYLDRIQTSFGAHDVSSVRAYSDSAASTAAASMGATAFATGDRVAFGSAPDLHTAAHEAAHVVQQRTGVHLKGGVGEDGDLYERHADAVADKVVAGESAAELLGGLAGGQSSSPVVQRKAAKNPAEELQAVDTVIAAHVDAILGTLVRSKSAETAGRDIAPSVQGVANLLWKATELARSAAGEPAAASDVKIAIDSIEGRVETLFEASRRAFIHMVQAGLEHVFAAEDAMLIATGKKAPNHRAGFYGDRTASDLAGVPRSREVSPGETGGELVSKIQRWFSYEPLRSALGLTDLVPILQEPPRLREPSTFESLLAAVANHVVGLLPGYLSSLLGSVIVDGATRVVEQSSSASGGPSGHGGFPMNTDASYVDRQRANGDAGASEPQGLARLAVNHPDIKQAIVAFAQVSPLAGKHVVAPVADNVMGGLVGQVGRASQAGSGDTAKATSVKDDKRPLSTAFVAHVSDGITTYMNSTVDKVAQLGHAMELLPPASLAAIYDGLALGAKAIADKLRVDLIAEWASFVAAASVGEDKVGNLAGEGTLQNLVEMPGVVQIRLRAIKRPRPVTVPTVEVQSISMNGMSESALQALRGSARPLANVKLHRVVSLTLKDGETGVDFPEGRFGLSPEDHIDVDDASWASLTQIAAGATPEQRPSQTEERVARSAASRTDVENAARYLLVLANKTTADIP